uniref:Uncharacterized protein n=1 Tax=Parascaris equorum TaxID=6256 RepID=A0A914RSK9_PAREQ
MRNRSLSVRHQFSKRCIKQTLLHYYHSMSNPIMPINIIKKYLRLFTLFIKKIVLCLRRIAMHRPLCKSRRYHFPCLKRKEDSSMCVVNVAKFIGMVATSSTTIHSLSRYLQTKPRKKVPLFAMK